MANENQVQVALQRIYLKDLSFESPDPVAAFKTKWEPKVNLDIRNQNKKVENDIYEACLEITATVKIGELTAFVVEIEQAGIFMIKGIEGDNLERVLGTFCMNVLFPYAREAIDGMCLKGSFPPLVLAPINFDQLYEQSKNQKNDK
ncbi:MAG: protein-export chaperone SecB [Pseudobacteriovorax sp.]|nr:protein-export chaperone SecB [Pseudobacteriovorax sp.]